MALGDRSSTTSTSASSSTCTGAADNYDWPTDSQSYVLQGKIGRGAFATVWKAIPKPRVSVSGCDESAVGAAVGAPACAIKILNLDHVDSDLQEIRREVQALKLSLHANVLTCYTAFLQGMHLWLVTTLMRKGSSLHCLQTARRISACPVRNHMEPHILYILHQSLTGLQYIHENQQLIHRDVKGGNVLIDSTGSVKIADFGVSQWLDYNTTHMNQKARTFVGTPCWMAPEVMEQHADGYDQKADVWSLGITALELAKGFAPYAKYPPMKVLILTLQEDPPSLDTYLTLEEELMLDTINDPNPNIIMNGNDTNRQQQQQQQPSVVGEHYSKLFSNLVEQCLQKNPARRPTCRDLLNTHKALNPMTLDASYLQSCQANLRDQVCAHVPDVGAVVVEPIPTITKPSPQQQQQQQQQQNNNQYYIPNQNQQVRIVMEQQTTADHNRRPKGTTWIFSDGSQVLSSTALRNGDCMSVDDVMEQLEDFGMQTGGEHYNTNNNAAAMGGSGSGNNTAAAAAAFATGGAASSPPTQHIHNRGGHHHHPRATTAEEDDMDDFLNSLEQTLPGEDYQRNE